MQGIKRVQQATDQTSLKGKRLNMYNMQDITVYMQDVKRFLVAIE